MSHELTGFVREVFPVKQVTDRFAKRELVIETLADPRYPQIVMFEAAGDNCRLLDHVKPGDELLVEFEVRGREWRSPKGETKYFNTLAVFAVTRLREPEPRRLTADELREELPPQEDDIPF